jgi:integrase
MQSTARHSRYWRQLQDLPVQGKRVALRLRLSRWRCRNRECEQAIFRERLGEVVATWARRTSRVEEVLLLVAPHDLRRTAAKLCRSKGGELEQIKFLLGHESILTTERYLGSEQDLKNAVNDALVFE